MIKEFWKKLTNKRRSNRALTRRSNSWLNSIEAQEQPDKPSDRMGLGYRLCEA